MARLGFGGLYGDVYVRDTVGNWSFVLNDVNVYLVGLRGATVNMLRGTGDFWKYNVPTPGLPISLFYPPNLADQQSILYQPVATDWSPPLGVALQSLSWLAGWGQIYVVGWDSMGRTYYNFVVALLNKTADSVG